VTRIDFYSNAGDRLQAACSWLAANWREKKSTVVFVPEAEAADRLARMLWIQPPTGFLPHCRAEDKVAPETPVLIAQRMEDVAQDACLLNLSDDIPAGFSRFEELVEIVSTEDSVRLPARERFRFYRERGYALENHNVADGF